MTIDPAGVAGAIVALVGGAIGGRALVVGVGRLVEAAGHAAGGLRPAAIRWAPSAAAVAAVVIWWWEVPRDGLSPAGVEGVAWEAAARCGGHLLLFFLLAAATWIDFRDRVIPDAITVPGVLSGLLCMAVRPGLLLPVGREVPRSYARPLVEADVLGLAGPLQGPWPEWLAAAPSVSSLVAALAVFAAWWTVGTAPADDGSGTRWARLLAPRTLVAVVGAATLSGAWLAGGDHWRGLLSSLGGLAVAAGILWLTRAGASLALGREAMGLGDVTLMAMVGAWLGWQPSLLACVLAVFIGLTHGIAQLVLRSEAELPFGPSLCLATALVTLGWSPLWERTAAFFERPLDLAAVVGAVIALTGATLWAWHRFRGFFGG